MRLRRVRERIVPIRRMARAGVDVGATRNTGPSTQADRRRTRSEASISFTPAASKTDVAEPSAHRVTLKR